MMPLNQIVQVIAICTPLLGGSGYVGKLIADQYYLSNDKYLTNEINKAQSEKALLEWEAENGGLTPRQQFKLKQLENLEKQLQQQLQQ
jgi:hypothetical protein